MITRRTLAAVVALAAMLGAAALLTSPTGAASSPRGIAVGTMQVNPSTVPQGDPVTVSGNLCPNGDVDLAWFNADHSSHNTTTVSADGTGVWDHVIDTSSLPIGTYTVTGTCTPTPPAGASSGRQALGFDYADVTFEVVAQATSSSTTSTTTTVPGATTTTTAPAAPAQAVAGTARFTG